jgi:hypothetical protein
MRLIPQTACSLTAKKLPGSNLHIVPFPIYDKHECITLR